ncbi:MAG: amidohydrolase family protein [Opitutales bacterium]
MFADTHMHAMEPGRFRLEDFPAGCSQFAEYGIDAHLSALRALDEVALLVLAPLSFCADPQAVIEGIEAGNAWKERTRNPETFVCGLLNADPALLGQGYFAKPEVVGVRLFPAKADIETFRAKASYPSAAWDRLFAYFSEHRKQVHLRADDPATIQYLFETIPPEIPVMMDHLALPGVQDPQSAELSQVLTAAARRGNVFFKGPGFRTSRDPVVAAPICLEILRHCGPQSLLLGATDAPWVWSDAASGRPLQEHYPDVKTAFDYVHRLARELATISADVVPVTVEALVATNALAAFGLRKV